MARSKAEVAMRLHAAAIHLLRTVRAEDRQLGLTPARLSVLSILVFGGPCTLSRLTDAEQVAPPTMTKLVAGLEADGLVRREPDPGDGRAWVIHATRKATRVLHKGRERRVRMLLRILSRLSASEWRQLERVVALLESTLASVHHADASERVSPSA